VWRPRRAADPSTNRRQGFLCRRAASMEQAGDRVEAAVVDQPAENIGSLLSPYHCILEAYVTDKNNFYSGRSSPYLRFARLNLVYFFELHESDVRKFSPIEST